MAYRILGHVFLGVAFFTTTSFIYYYQVMEQDPVELPLHQKSDSQTYQNPDYLFEISAIPGAQMRILRGDQQKFDPKGSTTTFTTNARTFVYVELPQALFPNTNFIEGWVSVVAAKDLTAPECKRSTGFNFNSIDNNIIRGIPYTIKTYVEAAAGNLYETEVYNTYQSNICYEISTVLHTSVIQNYEAGTVKEVDKKVVDTKFRSIINTFKLIESE